MTNFAEQIRTELEGYSGPIPATGNSVEEVWFRSTSALLQALEEEENELNAEDQAIIDRAWKRHKAAAPSHDGVYSRSECPFHYCDQPHECRSRAYCRHT